MNEPIRMKPEAAPPATADPERYFRLGESMLRQVRADLIEADLAWRRRRAELVDRARDELGQIDAEHEQRLAGLRASLRRLEAMRGGS